MFGNVYSSYVLSRPNHKFGARFNQDADNFEQVKFYYENRMTQALGQKIEWQSITEYSWGCECYFTHKLTKDKLYSVYVYASHRGKGHYPKWIALNPEKKIITFQECEIENFLQKQNHPYLSIQIEHTLWPEYKAICSFYESHCAERSGVLYINHIEEGLFILKDLNVSEIAQKAFVIHPMCQSNEDLSTFWERIKTSPSDDIIHKIDLKVILLAIEYRNIANGYLSFADPNDDPKLSPIDEVNQMLCADKIQNRIDFERFHLKTHPRAEILDSYFKKWLLKLEVTEEQFQYFFKYIRSHVEPNITTLLSNKIE